MNGGKVERRVGFKQQVVAHTKADRRHIQQQRRDAKRQEIIRRKRGIDGGPAPPRIVGIISLGENEEIEERLRSLLLGSADRIYSTFGEENISTKTAKYDVHKKDGNLTLLTNSSAFRAHYKQESGEHGTILAALDLCRICDMVLFVLDGDEARSDKSMVGISIGGDDATATTNKTSQDWDHLVSSRGDRILDAVKAQGLPRVLTVLARTEKEREVEEDYMTTQSAKSIRRSNLKKKSDLRKYASRFATTEFGIDNDKVVEVDLSEDSEDNEMDQDRTIDPEQHIKATLALALVRTLCTTSAAPSKWVAFSPRAYVVSDTYVYSADAQELEVTGYIRGMVPFDTNSLMHIPNLGTFACKALKKATPPHVRAGDDKMVKDGADTIVSDPTKRESLDKFATPDSLEGEQNLIGFDEEHELDDELEGDDGADEKNFARPAGWSDYQSAWLDAVDDSSIVDGEIDHGELAKELNARPAASIAPSDVMDLDDANQISSEERKVLIEQRRKEEKDHKEFPDEVQIKEDEKARERLARYRSLKSFRKSHWDPKENLPDTFASIFHFANFKATQRSVMADMRDLVQEAQKCDGRFWNGKLNNPVVNEASMETDSDDERDKDDILEGCVPSGSYVTLTIEGVSPDAFKGLSTKALLSVVTLLPHENKVSVLHMGLSHSTSCNVSQDVPVKSKDILTFRCGWRTWTGRPIFSQNNLNCDKHKFERFLPQEGSFFAGSVFGPVTYTPCPVLVFRDLKGQKELVATGSMITADADRIILKRIILTGYPVRVQKRFATVKYMFYDPEDVKWFKPAGLTTKHGLQGNIEDSVGEHGTMKCLFNAPIKQHDTVCLTLYKRIYPKFAGVNVARDDGGTVRSIRNRNILVVK